MPRIYPLPGKRRARRVDYRDIIESLVKKPRSLRSSVYRDELFPNATYRRAYEHFTEHLSADAATIDRLLAPVRGTAGRTRKRRTGKKINKQIAVRTFADWEQPEPGFLEVDCRGHSSTALLLPMSTRVGPKRCHC